MSDKDRVELGHISSPHGVRGEVLIKTYTETPEDLIAYKTFESDAGTLTLKKHRITSKGVIATFAEVLNRNRAEELKGAKLWVLRADLPDPDEDEFYYTDLIGLEARLEDGTSLGRIAAVQNFGADDLLEIKPIAKSPTILIPFTSANVPTVDIRAGQITVIPPQELGEESRDN